MKSFIMKLFSRKNSWFIIIAAIIIIYSVIVAIAPVRKLNELKKETFLDSVYISQNLAVKNQAQLFQLAKEKAFLEAQLGMVNSDSIGLIINLKDSLVSMSLKGVIIHSSKVENFKQDPFFKEINPLVYTKLFAKPLIIQSEYSSIVKEPIVIRKAPKDTIEALENAYKPDTLIQNATYFNIDLNHDIKLIFIQKEWLSKEDKEIERKYKSDLLRVRLQNIASSFLHLKKASYMPTLIIELDDKDIRSIYRAIPFHSQVVITY